MEEVKVRNNKTNLKVYVNGFPDLKLMPKEVLEILLTEIERIFCEHKYRKKSKK